MDKKIGFTDLQHKLRAVFEEVSKHGTPYILTRGKQPEVVLIPYKMYMRFARADESAILKRFDALLERMKIVNAKYSDDEVEADLKEATPDCESAEKKGVMRTVVDTNIMIRAVIKPLGTVGPVIVRLRAGKYQLIYSQQLLDELIAKLALPRIRQKYNVDDETVEDILALIALRGEKVEPTRKVKMCRDLKDDMVIEAAIAGSAHYVITGDEDLLIIKEFENIRFITPREFLEQIDR